MDFTLTEEQKAWRDKARDFAKEYIEPVAADLDKKGEFPYDNVKRMADLGFLGMPFPKEYGGQGTDYVSYVAVVEEVAKKDASHAIILSANNSLVGGPILRFGTEEQKKKYLPRAAAGKVGAFALTEPGAGSDASAAKTKAIADGDDYVINGTKCFISNMGPEEGDFVILIALTEPEKKTHGMSAIIVDRGTKGFTVGKREDKMGLRAADVSELIFDDCRVPKSQRLASCIIQSVDDR